MWQEVANRLGIHGGKQLDLEMMVFMTMSLVHSIGLIIGVNDLGHLEGSQVIVF